MQINNFEIERISDNLTNQEKWVQSLQSKQSPHGIDIRVEVKYEIPNGDVYPGEWCRPQNDAPGLRAITLIKFMNIAMGYSKLSNESVYKNENENKLIEDIIKDQEINQQIEENNEEINQQIEENEKEDKNKYFDDNKNIDNNNQVNVNDDKEINQIEVNEENLNDDDNTEINKSIN